MSSFYVVKPYGNNSHSVNSVDPIPGRSRALGFLKQIDNIFKTNGTINNIQLTSIAVNNVQLKVEKRKLYTIFSYIPFTEAYQVSRLILSVKKELAILKQVQVKNYMEDAKANTNNPYEFFAVPSSVMELENAGKPIYYRPDVNTNELGQVGMFTSRIHDFMNKRGILLYFKMEFDKTNNFMKLTSVPKFLNYKDLSEEESNAYAKEIMTALRSYVAR